MRRLAIITLVALLAVATIGCGEPWEETPPSQATPVNSPGAETPASSAKIIKDLAYVEAIGLGYSDDADPEDEGIEINLIWYDSKSELIFYFHVPIVVDIELYTTHFTTAFERELEDCVYTGKAHIDSSASDIRIPFEDIHIAPSQRADIREARLTVHTPQQGDYDVDCGILIWR